MCIASISGFAAAQTTDCSIGGTCVTPTGLGAGEQTTTRWYTGLVWEIGGNQGVVPDLIRGVRSLTVKNVDAVSGGDANVRIKLKDSSIMLDSARLAYVGGRPDWLGNAGLGYSFTHSSLLATGALQASHVRLSTDYLFAQNKFQFFGEINTLKKPEKVENGQLTCPQSDIPDVPYQLTDVANVDSFFSVPGSAAVDGKTCYRQPT